MALLIKKEGIFTSLQHCGRFGLQKFGINPSGAMDRTAARLLNVLLGNDECDAVLEMHFPAAEIVFEEGTVFAIGGADFQPTLDGKDIAPWRSNHAESSSRLKFSEKLSGQRCYLADRGRYENGKRAHIRHSKTSGRRADRDGTRPGSNFVPANGYRHRLYRDTAHSRLSE